MEQDYYEKVTRMYKILTSRQEALNYFDGYTIFDRERIEINDTIFNFLRQFENIPFSTFFTAKHMQEFAVPEKYFGTDTVVITDKLVKIHYDFSLVIFSYLCFLLRTDLAQLMDIINTGVLEKKFGKIISKDKYELNYVLMYHEEIHKFLLTQIGNYKYIFNLMNIATIYRIEEYHLAIKYPRIDKIFAGLDTQYKFDAFKIV